MNLLKVIFGTKNERELKKLWPIVRQINEIEEKLQKENLTDEDFPKRTQALKARVAEAIAKYMTKKGYAAMSKEDFEKVVKTTIMSATTQAEKVQKQSTENQPAPEQPSEAASASEATAEETPAEEAPAEEPPAEGGEENTGDELGL